MLINWGVYPAKNVNYFVTAERLYFNETYAVSVRDGSSLLT